MSNTYCGNTGAAGLLDEGTITTKTLPTPIALSIQASSSVSVVLSLKPVNRGKERRRVGVLERNNDDVHHALYIGQFIVQSSRLAPFSPLNAQCPLT